MKLEEIEKGKPNWKKRQLQNKILETLGRATTPQTGWAIWQKIRKQTSAQGNDVCIIMKSLCEQGHIKHVGYDDQDSLYIAIENNT